MEFRVLGPMEVWHGGRQVPLGGAKPRALLTALVLDAGHVLPVDRLIEAVWGEAPPPTARAVLQTYVAALRRAFDRAGLPAVIVSHRVGYLAEVPAEAVDRDVFERLAAEGRLHARDGRPAEAAVRFRAALALWQGAALGGIGDSFLRAEALRLEELRQAVIEERISAELATGRAEDLVDELTELVALHPVRERLRRDLMITLYRSGRQADALAAFGEGRRVLIEELGIEPGPELRRTHEAILRSDPALLGVAEPGPPPPRQLPSAPPDFTGREEEIATLRAGLAQAGSTPVQVISGAGGTGKTSLALKVAHMAAGLYPDGQLYVELRGTADAQASPEEILGRLLRQLDPAATTPPATLEERASRFRTLLAGRRKLLVLDDAASEAQVRPLLPGTPGCAVIVTSRNRLSGLAGAAFVDLGVLPRDAAMTLLARIAGRDRISADQEAAQQIVRRCGGLPLALRIAGARLAARRQWTIEMLAGRLGDERRRLDELAVGDQEVRASIGLSYRALTPAARTMLRRLGLLGLPSLPVWVAAAATDRPLEEAERVLEQLVNASLLDVDGADSIGWMGYRPHDLISLYARERAEEEDTPAERAATVERVLGAWLWLVQQINDAVPTTGMAMRATYRTARPLDPELARAVLADRHAWLREQETSLVVAIDLAAAMDLDEVAVELACALSGTAFGGSQYVFDNPFTGWHRTHEAALAVARRRDNSLGEAILLAGLGQLRYEQDLFAESRDYLSQSLSMFRAAGDARGEAVTLTALGAACREQGYLPEAMHFLDRAEKMWTDLSDDTAMANVQRLMGTVLLERGEYDRSWAALTCALRLYREGGSRRGEGMTLRNIALFHRARGELDEAERTAGEALVIFGAIGDQLMEAYALRVLAKVWLRRGRFEEARRALDETLATVRKLRDRFGEACTLRVIGECHLAEGRLYQARSHLEESLAGWEEIGSMVFRARTLHDLARVHDAFGDTAAGAAMRAEAMETFRSHGAREHAELAATE
ncbi:BTAD domain-containing putative transcriptional regulator [Acrocarpospora sp. B8E8]|uniref:AfsR/SARP family transcriptional regulator n=1 Tax=Acrocarpospora sp. B8E8 TaxID=3153572 RepID=UPI00325E3649